MSEINKQTGPDDQQPLGRMEDGYYTINVESKTVESKPVEPDTVDLHAPHRERLESMSDTAQFGETRELLEQSQEEKVRQWENLLAQREELTKKISSGEITKEEGEKQQRELSWETFRQGCSVLGKEFSKEREAVNKEEAEQWRRFVNRTYGDQERYANLERENAQNSYMREVENTEFKKRWDKMSEDDQRRYNNPDEFYEKVRGEIFERTVDSDGKGGVNISKEAFYGLMRQGYNPEDIKDAGIWDIVKYSVGRLAGWDAIKSIMKEGKLMSVPFSDVDGRKGSEPMTFRKLEDLMLKAEEDFKREAAERSGKILEESSKARQKDAIDQSIEQVILNNKIREFQAVILPHTEQSQQEQINDEEIARKLEEDFAKVRRSRKKENTETSAETKAEEVKAPEMTAEIIEQRRAKLKELIENYNSLRKEVISLYKEPNEIGAAAEGRKELRNMVPGMIVLANIVNGKDIRLDILEQTKNIKDKKERDRVMGEMLRDKIEELTGVERPEFTEGPIVPETKASGFKKGRKSLKRHDAGIDLSGGKPWPKGVSEEQAWKAAEKEQEEAVNDFRTENSSPEAKSEREILLNALKHGYKGNGTDTKYWQRLYKRIEGLKKNMMWGEAIKQVVDEEMAKRREQ